MNETKREKELRKKLKERIRSLEWPSMNYVIDAVMAVLREEQITSEPLTDVTIGVGDE